MNLLADIISRNKGFLHSGVFDKDQLKALNAIRICRTSQAGGDIYTCNPCDSYRFVYRSCGNRFCPKCQNHKTTLWLHRQKSRLLPCQYFMITFTVAIELRQIPRHRRKEFFDAFFNSSSQALKELTQDRLKGQAGMLGVLHTNGRDMKYHPHIHYLIPAMILNKEEGTVKKIITKSFLHHAPMAKLFKGKLLASLKELNIAFPSSVYAKQWNVDCEAKGSGEEVLEYLSKYLIKGVISPKYLSVSDGQVTLKYKETGSGIMKKKVFTEEDFLRSLAVHVLPKGFRRIREYGFLAPAGKKMLQLLQILYKIVINQEPPPPAPTLICPCCKKSMQILIHDVDEDFFKEKVEPYAQNRAPPEIMREVI